ncbi:MAG: LPS assembly lipoprotein LptE [Alphaproteobacteria bacterium]
MPRQRLIRLAALSLIFLGLSGLSACGFRPLYGTPEGASQSTAAALHQIYVAQINNATSRVGHLVYQKLERRLRQSGTGVDRSAPPRYRLNLHVKEREEGVAIEQDDTFTRFNIRLIATYELLDLDGNVLTKGTSQAVGTYNVVGNQYASHIGKKDAADRAATFVATDLTARLVSYFDAYGH